VKPFTGFRMDQLVIDHRFLTGNSSSYRARLVRLNSSLPFRQGKTMTSFSIKTRTQFRLPTVLVRLSSSR
jgi:hypothetical protein